MTGKGSTDPEGLLPVKVKTYSEILAICETCTLVKKVLLEAKKLCQIGNSTHEIDCSIHDFILSNNAYPSPLNYRGFPKSICTSVNNVLCHGIPDSRKLDNGDIINIDVSVYKNGVHGDASETFFVGSVSPPLKNFLRSDGWTAATRDGGYAAQFEHTILITEGGHKILT
ncbi:uncharacterized protein LOC135120486 [Zophobas morio]|uniref:uncharacterized protein LOC135120486 n=1 Tax=Zophobas morio TaxID=2755281 RepID=UPI0030832F06